MANRYSKLIIMERFKRLVLFLLAILMLWSCNQEEEKTYVVFADVFIRTQISEKDTLHAVVYSNLSYSSMKRVIATTPLGEIVELVNSGDNDLVYVKEPGEEDFSVLIPEIGKYSFNIVFDNNDTRSESNSLSEKIILPPEILGLEYDEDSNAAILTWKNVEGANAYLVKIFSGEEQIYASQPFVFDPPGESYVRVIPRSTFEQYLPGELVFEISSVLYESETNLTLLQALSGSRASLTIN